MFDNRAKLIGASAGAGMALACLGSLLAAIGGPHEPDLDALQLRIQALPIQAMAVPPPTGAAAARLSAQPLFAMTTGKGAVTDPAIRLSGIEIVGGRKAALLTIDDKPAAWLAEGASADGVTVMAVETGQVTLDTATGFKALRLGEATAGVQAAASASPASNPPTMPR